MMSELQKSKLKEFNAYLKVFIKERKDSIEDVHKLRVSCRELYSLFDTGNPFFKEIKGELKKIIKLTNKVRDLDVFLDEYLSSLSDNFIEGLDMKAIYEDVAKERIKEIRVLHNHLVELRSLKFEEFKGFSLKDKKILHRYRIFIKKRLYEEKNKKIKDTQIIEYLKRIKDLLGAINDNRNALERLSAFGIDDKLFKEIKRDTHARDEKLFSEFLSLVDNPLD